MEDKVYTQEALRDENILTMDYRLNLEVGRFVAVLDLKAEARKPNQEHYRCSNYKSNRGECQVHFIRELSLQKTVLKAIQDLAAFVQDFEPVFLYLMDMKESRDRKQEIANQELSIKNGKRRIEEIDRIISRMYEDNIAGKISDERYVKMAEGYEMEQRALSGQVAVSESRLADMKQKTTDLRLLLQTLRKSTEITELNRELVNRLIQRIEVHNNDKSSGHCHVQVDIYFTGAGMIDIPTEQDILRIMQEIRESHGIKSA